MKAKMFVCWLVGGATASAWWTAALYGTTGQHSNGLWLLAAFFTTVNVLLLLTWVASEWDKP
jgi:hypothetical protein